MMVNILRKNRFLLIMSILFSINIFVTPVLADVIVLCNGSELHGTIANKEQVATLPGHFSQISILIEEDGQAPSFQSIETDDIHYIVLEDNAGKRVIEFTKPLSKPKAPKAIDPLTYPTQRPPAPTDRKTDGILLATAGAGIALIGVLVKFGEEKVTITESSIDYDEETYNGVNYAMMVGGCILFAGGLFLASSDGSSTNVSGFHPYIDNDSGSLGLSYTFDY
jgi:hypothetical protein